MANSKIKKLKDLVIDKLIVSTDSSFAESAKDSAHFHENRLHRHISNSSGPYFVELNNDFAYDRYESSYESNSIEERAWW